MSAAALALPTVASAQVTISDNFATNTLGNYTNPAGAGATRLAFTYDSTNQRISAAEIGTLRAMGHNTTLGSFGTLSSVTVSVDFLTNSNLSNNTAWNTAAVALAGSAANVYGTSNFFDLTVRTSATTTNFLRFRINDSSSGEVTSSNFTLATSTWYTLSLTLEATGTPNVYNLTGSVINRDTSAQVGSVSSTVTRANTVGTDLFAGFAGGANSNRGAVAFDNFNVSAIPEPSSAAALFGVMALASVGLRRRRRAA